MDFCLFFILSVALSFLGLRVREFEYSGGAEFLARAQHSVALGPLGVVGRVGVVLRFEADGIAALIALAVFAYHAAVEEVASIYLHAGLVGEYLHCDACVGARESGARGG